MRAVKRNSGLWAYLSALEGFERFTEQQVKAARQAYWKQYDRRRQAEKRKEKREVAVIFPAEDIRHIRATARAKGYTIHEYIRACIRADMSQQAVIPHPAQVAEIMQVMRQCHNQLEAIKQKDIKSWLGISRTYENVETALSETGRRITAALKQPQNLKQAIIESIRRNPETITLILSILKEHGHHQIHDTQDG